MRTQTTDPDDILSERRGELDELDKQLLNILRRRIDCCVRIAECKREHGVAMMQPGRVGAVHQRAEAFGREHGISTDFLRALYEVIITETCRVEDLIIDSEPAPGEDAQAR